MVIKSASGLSAWSGSIKLPYGILGKCGIALQDGCCIVCKKQKQVTLVDAMMASVALLGE